MTTSEAIEWSEAKVRELEAAIESLGPRPPGTLKAVREKLLRERSALVVGLEAMKHQMDVSIEP